MIQHNQNNIGRRDFFKTTTAGVIGMSLISTRQSTAATQNIPGYLKGYANVYSKDPRQAAIQWFREAKFGLFLHYGLYSNPAGIYKGKKVPGISEWLQLRAKIHVAEYAKLKDDFTADRFDADAITELAASAGMKYINITTRHHDSFSLWDTKENDFNSVNSPAKRDLIAELAESCQKRDLGLCLYYSHGRDWRHPHAPNNSGWGGSARPQYAQQEPYYKRSEEHDLQKYVTFMKNQITELLTNYGPIAAIWLDGIGTPMRPKNDNKVKSFHCQELYDHIHSLQPQVLVSYKQGLLGTEDFKAPEHRAVKSERQTPIEICSTLQKGSWGYKKNARWLTPDEAMQKLKIAQQAPANLLLNIGPKGDGSIPAQAAKVLREVGNRIRQKS